MQPRQWIPKAVEDLPHWARVAFSARCARIALPLFRRYWSDAEPKHSERLETAIGLAERSAAEAVALPGLEDAETYATVTAGTALKGIYGFDDPGPVPTDEQAAHIACFVSKAAEWATTSALQTIEESTRACLEAYIFARDAAHAAEEGWMSEQMQEDLDFVHQMAVRRKWSHSTPVDPSVFDLLSDSTPRRPWWRLWRGNA